MVIPLWIDIVTVAVCATNLGAMQQNEQCFFCMSCVRSINTDVYSSVTLLNLNAALPKTRADWSNLKRFEASRGPNCPWIVHALQAL
jgi:hypothetical protein